MHLLPSPVPAPGQTAREMPFGLAGVQRVASAPSARSLASGQRVFVQQKHISLPCKTQPRRAHYPQRRRRANQNLSSTVGAPGENGPRRLHAHCRRTHATRATLTSRLDDGTVHDARRCQSSTRPATATSARPARPGAPAVPCPTGSPELPRDPLLFRRAPVESEQLTNHRSLPPPQCSTLRVRTVSGWPLIYSLKWEIKLTRVRQEPNPFYHPASATRGRCPSAAPRDIWNPMIQAPSSP